MRERKLRRADREKTQTTHRGNRAMMAESSWSQGEGNQPMPKKIEPNDLESEHNDPERENQMAQ